MPRLLPDFSHAGTGDHAACRAAIRVGSRSFYTASLALPADTRESALALYAFCRSADDVADAGRSSRRLARLQTRMVRAYDGRPLALASDRAFADVVRTFAIPRALPEGLLEGFEWDIAGRRYRDADALCDYAARVAGTVGGMFACLMGARSKVLVARACDLGIAMQLTNIARDVGEDARQGRIYLPLEWLTAAGIDPDAWVAAPFFDSRIADVIEKLVALSRSFYARARAGIDALPRQFRTGVHAAAAIYAEIGEQLVRNGCDSVSERTVVRRGTKLRLLGASALRAQFPAKPGLAVPTHRAAQFIVDAVVRAPTPAAGAESHPVDWLLELFMRLESRRTRTSRPLR